MRLLWELDFEIEILDLKGVIVDTHGGKWCVALGPLLLYLPLNQVKQQPHTNESGTLWSLIWICCHGVKLEMAPWGSNRPSQRVPSQWSMSMICPWIANSSQPDTWAMNGGTPIWIVATSANSTWSIFDGQVYGNRNGHIVGRCDRNRAMSLTMFLLCKSRRYAMVVCPPSTSIVWFRIGVIIVAK